MTAQAQMSEHEISKKALQRFLLQQVQTQQLDKQQALQFLQLLDRQLEPPPQSSGDIAIVGLACRLPEAENKTEFWQNLLAERSSIRDFPPQRLADLKAVMADDMPLFQGGFLDRVDTFDPQLFGISPQAALHMDPYQRLMLQVLLETIEDAGYQRSDLAQQAVGVFIGNDHTHRLINNYLHFIPMHHRDFQTMTGSWTGLLAGRLRYVLNLRGPAQVIDSSCSSGLVALDAAIKAIRAGDCQQALVGGINLTFLPGKNVVGAMENTVAQVCTFDQRASGTVWGEGVAAVLIKELSQATKDGDAIYAVIKGIALNSDGSSNGITAPNARAQQELLLQCWQRAGIKPEQISYVEAFGSGTQLGDPIEVKALSDAFRQHSSQKQFCGIGSVKTNIGHTVGASGLASLIKVLLALEHRTLPASLNFVTPNSFIDFCQSPLYVTDRTQPWQGPAPLTAGVSSFGLIGTNAHLVLQEYQPESQHQAAQQDYLLLLSARDPALLLETVRRTWQFVLTQPSLSLLNLSYTLAVGRSHHAYRLTLRSRDWPELIQQLAQLVSLLSQSAYDELPAGVQLALPPYQQQRQSEQARQALQHLTASGRQANLTELADCYLAGAQIDWRLLFAQTDARRLHLPPQPFLAQRYWFVDPQAAFMAPTPVARQLSAATDADPRAMYPQARKSQVLSLSESETAVTAAPSISQLAERVVTFVIAQTLGYQQLQLSQNFYALGGDSISAARILFILNRMLSLQAELSDLLATECLADFLSRLRQQRGLEQAIAALERGDDPASTALIQGQPAAEDYPVTPAQQRLFQAWLQDPHSTVHHVTVLLELANPADPALETAVLQQLAARHSSLRCEFFQRQAADAATVEIRQRLLPELAVPVQFVDVPAQSADLSALLQQVVTAQVQPFVLTAGPLWRICYLNTAVQRHFMLLDFHHSITDGTSIGIFLREYCLLRQGQQLPALSLNYQDYAVDVLARRQTEHYQQLAAYWQQKLANPPLGMTLATDFARPAIPDPRGGNWHTVVPLALTNLLRQFAVSSRCSLFVLLLAAYRLLMYRLGAGHDILIVTPVSCRQHHQLQPMVGLLMNMLVLRESLQPTESFLQLLARLKTNTLADFDQQHYCYEDVLALLAQSPAADQAAPLAFCFVLHNQDVAQTAGELLAEVKLDSGVAEFALTLYCREQGGELQLTFEYASSMFSARRIASLSQIFLALLAQLVQQPATSLIELELHIEPDSPWQPHVVMPVSP